MMMMESRMDEECLRSIQESTSLAEYFQNIVEDCKGLHPVIDDFIAKSSKLEHQIRSTIFAFSAFIETLQKIAHNASNTKGSSKDIGTCLLKVSIHQKVIETQLKNFASTMSNWLSNELKKKNEESKKKIRTLDKNHMKEFKGVRNKICSRIENIDKMRKKLKGNKQTEYECAELEIKISDQMRELYTDYRILEKQEKQAVRRIHFEERCQYSQLAHCVHQVLVEQGCLADQMMAVKHVGDTMERVITDNDNQEDDIDRMSNCSSLTSTSVRSLRSVTTSTGSSRSQSPLVPISVPGPGHTMVNVVRRDNKMMHSQGQCQDSSNRLSYISLPGDRTSASLSSSPSLDQGGHLARTRRTRPSSTYEMLSGRPPPYQMPSAHQGTYDRFPTVRRSGSSSPHRNMANGNGNGHGGGGRCVSLCRNISLDDAVSSPPSSLQIYNLPDFNVTHKNMVFPHALYDTVGQNDEENEDDLKTPTIENVLSINELHNGCV